MKSKESLSVMEDPILIAIETDIGRQLETQTSALVELDLPAAQIVMSFLIETLIKENNASLKRSPQVILISRGKKLISFQSAFEIASPVRTGVTTAGLVVGQDSGQPHLLNNKIDINISNRFVALAMNTRMTNMVKDILNHLPQTIQHTLPSRLARLGFHHQISSVQIYFDNDHIKAVINK